MGAIMIVDDVAVIDTNRCIGCGLCVSTCPEKALKLIRKPLEQQPEVPRDTFDVYLRMRKKKEKLKALPTGPNIKRNI